MSRSVLFGMTIAATCAVASVAVAQPVHRRLVAQADRPLTITPKLHAGVYRRGNDIIAPGGFSAHGYGYPAASPEDRKEAYNAYLRDVASGYGAGLDSPEGFGFDGDRGAGGGNPYYGNGYNHYVGFNGVPADYAFGPGFAMRHLSGHDPLDDDDKPGPSPSDLGYSADPDE